MRAALYARVSTDDQQTPGLQVEATAVYIKGRDWDIVRQVKDVGYGARKRPGREGTLKAEGRREIDVVVVWRLNRWDIRHPVHSWNSGTLSCASRPRNTSCV
jgi:putative DNA-invertase from lambdoid prophage Rac